MLGINQALNEENHCKHFYMLTHATNSRQDEARRLGMTNIHSFILDIQTGADILLNIEDKASSLGDRIGSKILKIT
ncbi:MAG: hypothetical protein MRQ09_06870 [Candidatus Midichloria sp.]|nr:hypothetical protein [Candidatus Midichloria sp.]